MTGVEGGDSCVDEDLLVGGVGDVDGALGGEWTPDRPERGLGAQRGGRACVRGGQRIGLVMAAVVGIVGALLAGWLAMTLFDIRPLDTFFDLSTWVTAIVGAVIVLFAARALKSGRSRGRRGRTRFGV